MPLTHEERKEVDRVKAELRKLTARKRTEDSAKLRAHRKEMVKRVGKRAPEQRQPRERDPGYLAFLRRLPCIAGLLGDGDCEGATQAAHLRFSDHKQGRTNPGLQSKPSDRHATPLCAGHHLRDQHAGEERAFWNRLGIDPGDLSNALYAAYLAGEDGAAAMRRFCPAEYSRAGRALGRAVLTVQADPIPSTPPPPVMGGSSPQNPQVKP